MGKMREIVHRSDLLFVKLRQSASAVFCFLFSLLSAESIQANPADPTVVSGEINIRQEDKLTEIRQSSDKGIINWGSFSIRADEHTQFIQPSSSSITLNRVTGNEASSILGRLSANGRVWLINRNGILFGAGARINVAGLLATTADITNQDFLNGNYRFTQDLNYRNSVINRGEITIADEGMVALVAPGVENSGIIQARLGKIALASGNSYALDLYGDQLIHFEIASDITQKPLDEFGNTMDNAVKNTGSLYADGGSIQLTARAAKNVVQNVINTSGIIEAKSVAQRGGTIILGGGGNGAIKIAGKIRATGKATGQKGGKVIVTNDNRGEKTDLTHRIELTNAEIDVSGDLGGGEIYIGGSYQGKGPLPNTSLTYMSSDSSLYADALTHGNGGTIILWADEATGAFGNIFARGGAQSGDGGFIETSAHHLYTGGIHVDASSPHGESGLWLLDPYNVTITSATSNGSFNGGSPNVFTPSGDDATVDVATINNSLDTGTNVTILTTGAGAQAGNITIDSPIVRASGTGTRTLTLTADGAITQNASITNSVSGQALNIVMTGTSISLGVITLTSGDLTLNGNGAVTQTGALTIPGTTTITAGAANNITLDNASNNFGNIRIVSANNVNLRDTNALAFATGVTTISGTLDLVTAGNITDNGSLSITGVATLTAGSLNDITLDNSSNNFSTVSIVSADDVILVDTNSIIMGDSSVDNLTLTASAASSSITDSGTIVSTGVAEFTAGTSGFEGDILFDSANNNFNFFRVVRGNNIVVNDISNITLGDGTGSNTSTISGNLSVTTGGDINQFDILLVTGTPTFTVTGASTNIGLGAKANNFVVTPVFLTSGAGTIRDLNLRNVNVTAAVPNTVPASLHALRFTYDNAPSLQLPSVTLSSDGQANLTATASGPITQAGPIVSSGVVSLTAGAGNNITLDDAGNNFATVTIVTGNNVTLRDSNGLIFGASTISGTLDVTTGGAITDSGDLSIAGLATFTAASNSITLNNTNSFSAIKVVSASSATFIDSSTTLLDDISTSGAFSLTTTGAVTQEVGKSIITGGTATFAAGASNDITLTNSGNNFATLTVSTGNNVSANDSNAIILGSSTISGTFGITAGGSISQSGTLTITGTPTFTIAGADSDILLATSANNFSTTPVFATTGLGTIRDIALRNTNASATVPGSIPASLRALTLTFNNATSLQLPSITLTGNSSTGNLSATANGAITQAGAIVAPGTTTIVAGGGNNITLDHGSNDFGTVTITTGNNVTLNDINSIVLGASTISGTLGVTASGSISQSGTLTVTGTPTFTVTAADSDILLSTSANSFTVTPVFAVSGAGTIRDLFIRNTRSAAVLPGTIPSTLRALTVVLNNSTSTVSLPGYTLTGDASTGNLSITVVSPIAQTGALIVPGTATFSTQTGHDITLSNTSNDFRTVSIPQGNNTQLMDINDIDVGSTTVNGNLTITAQGAGATITDSGNLSVAASLTLTAGTVGSPGNITLDSSGNAVSSYFRIVRGNDVVFVNTLPIPINTSTVSGTYDITSNGNITQVGALTITGTPTFRVTAANSDILLATSSNNFSTTPVFAVSGAGSIRDISLRNTNASAVVPGSIPSSLRALTLTFNNATSLVLPSLTLTGDSSTGNLSATANGAITQAGAIVAPGTTTLAAGSANNITLDHVSNNFNTLLITNANNVILQDANELDLGASTISGTLNVTSNGAITDSGNLAITGKAIFTAGSGNNITLDSASNNFSTIAFGTGNNVSVIDSNAIILDGLTSGNSVISGTLSVTAAGSITQGSSFALVVTGTPTFTVTAADSDILLTNDNPNNFNTTPIFATSGSGTIRDINLRNTNASAVYPNSIPSTLRALTLQFDNASGISLPGLTLTGNSSTGNLSITVPGLITQTGGAIVPGTATFVAGSGNNITLNNANNFSSVGITSANDVVLNDINAIDLMASTISGTLGITSSGAITDSGNLSVTGTTTLAAGSGNNITLNNSNNFSTVTITTGNDVTLVDTGALNLGASTISGLLSINAGGAVDLAASSIGSTLGITTTGAITDSGNLTVTGVTTLAAGSGNNITLNNNNNFSTVTITTGNDVTLVDTGALNLGASTISGLLSINAGGAVDLAASSIGSTLGITTTGAITDSGALTVTGATTLAAGSGNNITLNNANDFSSVGITSANDVVLNDINAIDLAASTISGTYNVTAAGAITDSGNLAATGAATFASGSGNDITLNNANDFSSVGFTTGNNITLNDINAVDLAMSTISGNLTVTSSGAITDSGTVAVTGTASFAAGSSNNITLNEALDNFATLEILSANDVTVVDVNALELAASTISGALNVSTSGAITDSGNVAVTGAATLAAGSANNITLNNNNNFSTVNVSSGNNVTLVDSDALTLGALNVSGTLNANAGGSLTSSQAFTMNDATALTANGDINLNAGINGNEDLTLTLSGANRTLGINAGIGTSTGLNAFTFSGANTINLNNDIVASTITGSAPVVTVGSTSIDFVDAIQLLNSGGTLNLANNTYNQSLAVNKSMSLNGNGSSINGLTSNLGNNLTITGNLTSQSAVTLNGSTNLNSGTLTVSSGNAAINGALTLAGGNLTTSNGNLNIAGAFGLSGNSTLTMNGDLTLGGAVNGNYDLALAFNGANRTLNLNVAVGDVTPLASLAITGATTINVGSTLSAGTTSGNAANVGVTSTAASLSDAVGFLQDGGTLNFTNNTYNQTLTVSKSATIDGNGSTLSGLVLDSGKTLILVDNLTSQNGATLNGSTTFSGGTLTVSSGNANVNGAATFSGGTLTSTSGNLVFADTVTLGSNTTLTSGGDLTFGGAVNGAHDLNIAQNGALTINGAVGNTAALTNLNISGASSINLNNNINATAISGTANTVNVGSTNADFVDAVALTNTSGTLSIAAGDYSSQALNVNKNISVIVPSNTLQVASLTTGAANTVTISGNVTGQSGAFTFNGPILLGGNSSLTNTAAGITFGSTLNGAHGLTLNTGNTNLAFNGTVGGATVLSGLTIVDAGNPLSGVINATQFSVAGRQGGTFTGSINGNSTGEAAKLVTLGSGAAGSYTFNGCAISGGCAPPPVITPQETQAINQIINQIVTPVVAPAPTTPTPVADSTSSGSSSNSSSSSSDSSTSSNSGSSATGGTTSTTSTNNPVTNMVLATVGGTSVDTSLGSGIMIVDGGISGNTANAPAPLSMNTSSSGTSSFSLTGSSGSSNTNTPISNTSTTSSTSNSTSTATTPLAGSAESNTPTPSGGTVAAGGSNSNTSTNLTTGNSATTPNNTLNNNTTGNVVSNVVTNDTGAVKVNNDNNSVATGSINTVMGGAAKIKETLVADVPALNSVIANGATEYNDNNIQNAVVGVAITSATHTLTRSEEMIKATLDQVLLKLQVPGIAVMPIQPEMVLGIKATLIREGAAGVNRRIMQQ